MKSTFGLVVECKIPILATRVRFPECALLLKWGNFEGCRAKNDGEIGKRRCFQVGNAVICSISGHYAHFQSKSSNTERGTITTEVFYRD